MSFPRYPAYKDSGVEWLGEVPEHWTSFALKRVVCLQSGDTISSEDIEEDGTYPVYGGNGFRGYTSHYTHDGTFALIGRQGALCGNVNYASGRFWASEHAVVATPITPLEVIWLGELLRAMNLNQYSISAAQPGLSVEAIGRLRVPFPPTEEQRAIATFLDRETAKIDTLVADYRTLIDRLQEKRQAVISHAVTKGLDPTVPMKDSGVEWLGEVPGHWRIKRNKALFSEFDNRSISGEGELLSVSHLTGVTPRSEKNVNMIMAETLEGYKECAPGDLVINTMWAWMGALGISANEGLVSPSYNVYRLRYPEELVPEYYDYLCRTPAHVVLIKARSTGVWESRLRLYADAFFEICTPVPPLNEQYAIVGFLDQTITELNGLITDSQEAITLLQERRTALISAAVTGKIDVRGLVEPEAA